MKILRIIGSADPRGGGPIEGVVRSSAAMAELGHLNEIVTPDRPGDAWLADLAIPIHPLGSWTKRYHFCPNLTGWLLDNVESYDAAIVHGLWSHISIGAWMALSRRRTPYFVFPHGMLDPWFLSAQPLKGMAKRAYWRALEFRVLRDASGVLFTSEEERRLAQLTFGGGWRASVVAYGTAAPPATSVAQDAAFRRAVPGLLDRPYLLFLSRIHPKKGCDMLIEAFSRIAAQRPELQLVVAGPDQTGWRKVLDQRCRQLGIADRVHWPGMLAGDSKWGAYYGAEAFVLPSHQENFGIVVAEAMACGRPVLITEGVNIWREVVSHGAGYAAPADQAGVDTVLKRFLALSAADRKSMGHAARECFLQRFEIRSSARDILSRIEEVSGHDSRA